MKKILILLLAAASVLSCAARPGEQKKDKQNTKKENTMGTIHLNKNEFLSRVVNYEANPDQWKYLGDKPAIVDFYASWCGPCRTIAPILEELAEQYKDQIYIYKVNTEEEQELAAAFNIRSIPTLLFIPMTGSPQIAMGAMSKENFEQAIREILLNNNGQ